MAIVARTVNLFIILIISFVTTGCAANDILGCGGFVKSHVKLDYSEIEIGLYTKEGSLKEKTECAPTNGYYFLPLYEKGEYILKVHPPAGLSFEPSEVALSIDGVTDRCSTGQDINFAFNGFGINGRVITLGQEQGPSGVAVQLVSEKDETRETVTMVGGDFHFTAVIPGKYTVKASHPRWKLEPSQVEVQMKEGKMALPLGVVLAVKGYDVKGSVTSFGSPIEGVYVLLYSKEESPKYRVEGCNTALLQGVPGAPICHVMTDAAGEFTFGLVPAGEYRLAILRTTPGQVDVTYNVRPDAVPFTVRHDSLYIKNAFEVTGFTVVGSVQAGPGRGLAGARVLLDGAPAGHTDAAGRLTLPDLQPGLYTVSFQHEKCEVDDVQVRVESGGPRGALRARAARWRVCGDVTPAAPRRVLVRPAGDLAATAATAAVRPRDGEWCTYLPPGVYYATVEVSEQEESEGLQYYPLRQQVAVEGPVAGVSFSQLKARVRGRVRGAAGAVSVGLRPRAAGRAAPPRSARTLDGEYVFEDVLPGSVEVSVPTDRLCWAESRHDVAVTQAEVTVPTFEHVGYVVNVHSTHAVEVAVRGRHGAGPWRVPRLWSRQCAPAADQYTLTPLGCHRFDPPHVLVDTGAETPATVYLVAVAHAVGVVVTSPTAVDDLVLLVDRDGRAGDLVGPLRPDTDGGPYVFTHTLYLADGEVAVVSARSGTLLFQPSGPQQVRGGADCQPAALTLRARPGLTLAGRLLPPVPDVTLTLRSPEGVISQTSSADGTYRFGPLDASQTYTVVAEKESYVFSEPDDNGDIKAHKLAEIIVELVDDADETPLQGALVSVSGGAYRRNAVSPGGPLRFGSLSPADYYVKPHMKEYRFSPPHAILAVREGRAHSAALRGVRVAWSCIGALVSLSGQGWPGATVAAVPVPGLPKCVVEEATTETSGAFRIRGLLPTCEYTLQLRESTAAELQGLRLVKAPAVLKVENERDVTGVRLVGAAPPALTDGSVLVRAAAEHYRWLRLTLAPALAPRSPLYAARLDAPGPPPGNPGVMVALPRLAADNRSYVVQLECSLARATHSYGDHAEYFTSDGGFYHFTFHFQTKVKSSEQELRQSSFLLIPALGLLALAYRARARLGGLLGGLLARARAARPRPPPAARPGLLDQASIDHILTTVNAAGKNKNKKKFL